MGHAVNHRRPDLSSFSSREMVIPSSRNLLEANLAEWMAEVVRHTKNPPTNGVSRATELVANAVGIDVIMHAPATMALGSGAGKRKIYARFLWGRLAGGDWYVRGVVFSTSFSSQHELHLAEQRALKEKLLDKAEMEYARRYHPREGVFPAEKYVDTFAADIAAGDSIIAQVIQRGYQHAKAAAKTWENPIKPKDLAFDVVGKGVGLLGKAGAATERAEHLAEDYEKIDKAKSAKEAVERGVEAAHGEKSWGDAALETAVDAAGFIPGAGPFVKTIAGFMFDIAIANQASVTTKIRSRAYVYFVAGFIQGLTYLDTGTPPKPFDKRYFDWGFAAAPPFSSKSSYQAQLSLLYYASDHYTAGGWGGLTYLGYKHHGWLFPNQYIVNWSPQLLGASLATQIHKIKYLVD